MSLEGGGGEWEVENFHIKERLWKGSGGGGGGLVNNVGLNRGCIKLYFDV